MLTDGFVRCPWCQGTGKKDYNGISSVLDYSTVLIPDENMCPKCSGRIDANTTFGGGWINIDRIFLRSS